MVNETYYNQSINLEEIANTLIEYIYAYENNDDIFKLLKYDTMDALSQPNLTFEEKIELKQPLEDFNKSGIILSRFTSIVVEDTVTQIRIYIQGDRYSNNVLSDVAVGIEVICHNDIILLKNGINRLLRMKTLIQQAINGENIGLGRLYYGNSILLDFNDKFQGYRITFNTRTV